MSDKVMEVPAMAEDVYREATRIGSKVSDALKDAVKEGVRTANQQIDRGREVAEEIREAAEDMREAAGDMLDQAKHTIKRKPFASAAFIFAAGFLAGGVFACSAMRRR